MNSNERSECQQPADHLEAVVLQATQVYFDFLLTTIAQDKAVLTQLQSKVTPATVAKT